MRITVSQHHSMRTTLTLDDDIFEAAQAMAQASGERLGKVVSKLARKGLRASAQTTKKRGIPVFKVRGNAEIIPSGRAKDLLAEEES